MEIILLTGDECVPCKEAEEAFKKKYAKEIASGEADIYNLDENEEVQKFWMEHDLPFAPTIVVVTEDLKLIATLDADKDLKDFMKQADSAPSAQETVKAPIESSGNNKV